jgi:hypothetical protein
MVCFISSQALIAYTDVVLQLIQLQGIHEVRRGGDDQWKAMAYAKGKALFSTTVIEEQADLVAQHSPAFELIRDV